MSVLRPTVVICFGDIRKKSMASTAARNTGVPGEVSHVILNTADSRSCIRGSVALGRSEATTAIGPPTIADCTGTESGRCSRSARSTTLCNAGTVG